MNKRNFIILFTVAALTLLGCKDDDNSKPANQFTFNKSTHAIKTTIVNVEEVEADETIYRWDIAFFDPSFEIDIDDHTIRGVGNVLVLSLISDDDNVLTPGTYTFGADDSPFSFFETTVYINFNSATNVGDEFDDLSEGTVTVAKDDDVYTIEFEGKVDQGKKVSGKYTGPFESFD